MSRRETLFAVLGWFVAVIVGLPELLQYFQGEREAARQGVYKYAIETHDPDNFPAEVRSQPLKISHPFSVEHVQGPKISGLEIRLDSPHAEIVDVVITAGTADVSISKDKKSAMVKAASLLSDSAIRGTVETNKIATVGMSVGADGAISESVSHTERDWDVWTILFLVGVALASLLLFTTAASTIISERKPEDNIWLLLAVLLLNCFFALFVNNVLSITSLVHMLILYYLVTRYHAIDAIIRGAARKYSGEEGPAKQ